MVDTWQSIQDKNWHSLIIGNGFSINISDGFQYSSLLDNVDRNEIKMYPCARELFDKVGTKNFEEILRVIYHAYLVNFYNLDAIKTMYQNVRKSLIESVDSSHVSRNNVCLVSVEAALSNFSKIFTTNYDLIPYWAILENGGDKYRDFFWSNSSYSEHLKAP